MDLLYRILKGLLNFAFRAYFRRFSVSGKRHIPNNVPVIFVANHPSMFMDPLAVGAVVPQPLYFLAAAEYFGKGFKNWFFRRFFHMIPVYRPKSLPGEVHKNQEMFQACYDHLAAGKSILIFPEGNSINELHLRELKTGVARIALGAEAENNFRLRIEIVPVGLNYSNPNLFQSDLHLNIGKAIRVADFREEYLSDHRKAVSNLTAAVADRLKERLIHIDDKEREEIFLILKAVYFHTLKNESEKKHFRPSDELELSKELVSAINYFSEHQPERVKNVKGLAEEYIHGLNDLGVKDLSLPDQIRSRKPGRIIKLIFGFPVFVFGLVNNFIPYRFSGWLINKLKIEDGFRGSVLLAAGMGLFLIYYLGISLLLVGLTGMWWLMLFYWLIMFYSGILALRYSKTWERYRRGPGLLRMVREKPEQLADVILKRKQLLDELEKARLEYVSLPKQ